MATPDLEQRIRDAHERGDLETAATLAIRGYGPELLGFLTNTLGDVSLATDAFGRFTEDLWRGLPAFGWRSSFRTWSYTLARNAGHRLRAEGWHRRGERLATAEVDRAVAEVRDQTAPHLRTTMKDRVSLLRAGLEPEDRELLVLRVDRGLEWAEVAEIVFGGDEPADPKVRRRQAAMLRKRYERVVARLRQHAEAAGLLG